MDPGICGFPCVIEVKKEARRSVSIAIRGSDCGQIKKMAKALTSMTLQELFMPATRNPAFTTAQKSGCHPSCVVPVAVLKTVEVAMEMALPKDVHISFG